MHTRLFSLCKPLSKWRCPYSTPWLDTTDYPECTETICGDSTQTSQHSGLILNQSTDLLLKFCLSLKCVAVGEVEESLRKTRMKWLFLNSVTDCEMISLAYTMRESLSVINNQFIFQVPVYVLATNKRYAPVDVPANLPVVCGSRGLSKLFSCAKSQSNNSNITLVKKSCAPLNSYLPVEFELNTVCKLHITLASS